MTIHGLILSGPRYELFRQSETPVREIYLENDHRVHYLVGERTKGIYVSGLLLSASLSTSPGGISAAPYIVGALGSVSESAATSSFTSSSVFVGSVTHSTIQETYLSSSFLTSSITTGSLLEIELTETPPNSGDYIGTFAGADITAAFTTLIEDSGSLVLSQSFGNPYTSSVSASVSESVIVYPTQSFATHTTESIQSIVPNADPRKPGVYEIITSGSYLKVSTPLILRSVRFAS